MTESEWRPHLKVYQVYHQPIAGPIMSLGICFGCINSANVRPAGSVSLMLGQARAGVTSASLRRASELKSSSSKPSTTCNSCFTAAESGLSSPVTHTAVPDLSVSTFTSKPTADACKPDRNCSNQFTSSTCMHQLRTLSPL